MDQFSSFKVSEGAVTTKQKWMVFCAMCLAIFTVAFATTATTNAMVPIREQMNLDPSQLQWTTNAYMLAAATLMVLGGLLSDRFGRRNMNCIGGFIFILGSVLSAASTIASIFILGRFIQGVGVAVIMPGTLALMRVVFPEDEQEMVTTGWAVAIGLGMGLGPFLSGVFCNSVGWQYLFALIAVLMLLAIALLLVSGRRRASFNTNVHIDFAGFVVYLLGFGLFVCGFIEGSSLGWSNTMVIVCLVVGMFIMCWQPWVERHVFKTRFINFSYFKRPRFALGCIGMFVDGFLLINILYFGNLYIQNPILLGYTPYQAGLAVIPLGVGLSLSVLTVEKLYDRIGLPACIQLLMWVLVVGVIWFVCLGVHTRYALVWEPFFIIGVGCGMATKAFPAMGIQALSSDEAARSSSIVSTFLYIGVIFSTAIGTILATSLGRRHFLEMTSQLPVPMLTKLKVENAVIGHPEAIRHIVANNSPMLRHALHYAAQLSALKGFQYAMLSSLVFLVLAMVAANMLLKMKKYYPSE